MTIQQEIHPNKPALFDPNHELLQTRWRGRLRHIASLDDGWAQKTRSESKGDSGKRIAIDNILKANSFMEHVAKKTAKEPEVVPLTYDGIEFNWRCFNRTLTVLVCDAEFDMYVEQTQRRRLPETVWDVPEVMLPLHDAEKAAGIVLDLLNKNLEDNHE